MRYVQLRLDAHDDPRLQRAGGCAFNTLNAMARLIAREAGADGYLAPRWCDLATIARWACEENQVDVRAAIGSLVSEGCLSGSMEIGFTIAADLWADYVNERLRKRLAREKQAKDAVTVELPASAGGVESCGSCEDGMLLHPNGRYRKCCSCPRGRQLAQVVRGQKEGERESARRRSSDVVPRSEQPEPIALQGTLPGIMGRIVKQAEGQ